MKTRLQIIIIFATKKAFQNELLKIRKLSKSFVFNLSKSPLAINGIMPKFAAQKSVSCST